jgi:quinol monooxygenase YgiN
MIILAGTVRVTPDKTEALRPHMETMMRASQAETGCRAYSLAFDLIDPGLIRVFEMFDDIAARDVHWGSAHMKSWRAACAEQGVGERNMAMYEIARSETV